MDIVRPHLKNIALAIIVLFTHELYAKDYKKAPNPTGSCEESSLKMNVNSWSQHFTGYGEAVEFDKAKSAALTDLTAYFGIEIDSKRTYSDRSDSEGGSSTELQETATNRVKSFLLGAKVLYSCRAAGGWRIMVGVEKSTAQKMFRNNLDEKITNSRSFLQRLERNDPREITKKILASSLRKDLLESKAVFELASDSKSNIASGMEELRKLSDFIGQSTASAIQVITSDDLAVSTFIDLAIAMGARNIWIEPAKSEDSADGIWRCTTNYAPAFSGVKIFQGRCDLVLKGTPTTESLYRVDFEGMASNDKSEQAVTAACKRSMRK